METSLIPMPHTATVKRQVSHDGFSPTYSSTAIACRVKMKRSRVIDRDGNKVVSNAMVETEYEVLDGDLINYRGRDWPIIAIGESTDVDGTLLNYQAFL